MKCWICGKTATKTKQIYDCGMWIEPELSTKRRCYCDDCFKRELKQEILDNKEYVRLRKKRMIKKAIDTLEKQNTDMYEYREAIQVITDFIEKEPDKIDSSYEALAAIVLVHNRIHAKMQHKVGNYQVDFLLPELFVVLEIDGERHKHRKGYDTARDKEIKKTLGEYWEVIRIGTELLDQNAKKLPEAIHKIIDYRETNHFNWREP